MVRSVISITSRVRKASDNVPAMRAALKRAGNAHVEVGVVKDAGRYANGASVEMVAAANEFGTDTIPERSFMRRTLYEKLPAINALRREQLLAIALEGRSISTALGTMGTAISEMIKNTIKSNVGPPLSPKYAAYKRRKGLKAGTLQATQLLLRSIGWRVVGGSGKGGH